MKILVQPYTHTLSHISRPLAVAAELRARGHQILFAGESSKVRFIADQDFSVLPCYEPDPDVLFGNIRSGKLKFASEDVIAAMLQADLALYRDTKPDLVLTDGRFTAPISSHIAGIPHAAIVNVSSTEYRAQPYIPFFEWIPEGLAPGNSLVRQGLDSLNLFLEMLVFDNVMSVFKKLSRRHGLNTTITATNCLTGKDLTLLADIPEYFPTRNLPPDYRYIGPITWKTTSPPPAWWPPPKGGGPIVYVTMGTTGIGNFFQKIHKLFQGSNLVAVVTTGAQTEGLASIEGRVYLESYLDGDIVIDAADLVVCHGGNGTIYQTLQLGKPIIGIPTIPDQQFNMRRVEALGVGKTLTLEQFDRNNGSLLDLIAMVLADPSYKERAGVLRKTLMGYADAPRLAADIIEQTFQAGKRGKH